MNVSARRSTGSTEKPDDEINPATEATTELAKSTPLYPADGNYRSDSYESLSLLLEVDAQSVQDALSGTPFSYVSAHVWVEVMKLHDCNGLLPYSGGGVVIPARYGDVAGGYYAFCYVDTDDSLALGREVWGYPKKLGRFTLQRTGNAVVASLRRRDAAFDISLVLGQGENRRVPMVPHFPHLMEQSIPGAEGNTSMLKRVISRDTSTMSTVIERQGAGAFKLPRRQSQNELDWLIDAAPIAGYYNSGSFRGVNGRIEGVDHVGDELLGLRL